MTVALGDPEASPAITGVETGQVEGDPVMAAVLSPAPCLPVPDADGDRVGDACDCRPGGTAGGPGEPGTVRVLADQRTFTFTPDGLDPGLSWRLLRGDLARLRSSGLYEVRAVGESATAGGLDDVTLPTPTHADRTALVRRHVRRLPRRREHAGVRLAGRGTPAAVRSSTGPGGAGPRFKRAVQELAAGGGPGSKAWRRPT
jgi:hypothetical protein